MNLSRKLVLTNAASVAAAFTCGIAYEWGRKIGKEMPAMSPKEMLAGLGGAVLQANQRETRKAARAHQEEGDR